VTEPSQSPELVLIVGPPRSGTTLLRTILDAHPEIACPAETGFPGLIGHTRQVWAFLCASRDPLSSGDPMPDVFRPEPMREALELPADVEPHIRDAMCEMMRYYCQAGERFFCDKSLGTVYSLPAVRETFPSVRCIVLVRHVMDTVLSGIEACPWGFGGFGYAPYISASPENTVAALARYWEEQVSLALEWSKTNRSQTHIVRYENLVDTPSAVLDDLWLFLGVEQDRSVLDKGLREFSPVAGPGDPKLAYRTDIEATSVGRGRRVPINLIPPPMLERINTILMELGYPAMEQDWNRVPASALKAPPNVARELQQIMASMCTDGWDYDIERIAIVADDDATLRWVVEPGHGLVHTGDGQVDLVIAGSSEDLLRLLGQDANIGLLTLNGQIRKMSADDDLAKRVDLPRMMMSLVQRFGRQEAEN